MKQTEEDIIPVVNTHAVLLKLIWTTNLEPEECLSATKSGVQLLATGKKKKKKKNSKEAKLMERKVCFIFDAGPKANSCPDDQMTRAFLDGGRRLHVETIVNS